MVPLVKIFSAAKLGGSSEEQAERSAIRLANDILVNFPDVTVSSTGASTRFIKLGIEFDIIQTTINAKASYVTPSLGAEMKPAHMVVDMLDSSFRPTHNSNTNPRDLLHDYNIQRQKS